VTRALLQGGSLLARNEQLLVMVGNRFEITDYKEYDANAEALYGP
jgi:hypothetical protein